MDDDDKTYLYLTLDQLIWATVRLDDDLDRAIVSAVDEFAIHRGTALWIEDTADGSPRKFEDPATARLGLLDNHTVVDIFVRSGRSPTDDYALLMSDKTATRFSLVVVSAEAEYSAAISALRTEVATRAPGDDEATYDIQVLKDAVASAGERASGAHPPIGIDFHSEIDAVLAESAWRLTRSRIASRVSGIQIGAITRIDDWEKVPAVRFKFKEEDEVTWRDAFAFVRKEGVEWKVAPREVSWLQERKRQYRINDAQISVLHQLLEEQGIREE